MVATVATGSPSPRGRDGWSHAVMVAWGDPRQSWLMALVSCLCGFTWVQALSCLLLELMAVAAKTRARAPCPPSLLVSRPALPCCLPLHALGLEHRSSVQTRLRPAASVESVLVSGNSEWLPLLYVAFIIMIIISEITTLPGNTLLHLLAFLGLSPLVRLWAS